MIKKLMSLANSRFIGFGILLIGVLLLSYLHYSGTFQKLEYQIFDFSKTGSWQQSKGEIYRTASKGESDTTLLSKDIWRYFNLAFDIGYPRNCGVAFNYEDANNFYFVYFRQKTKSILLGLKRNGKTSLKKQIPLPPSDRLSCRLQKKNQSVILSVNGKFVSNLNVHSNQGRLGLMIKEAHSPRMTFDNISVEGRTAKGGFIKSYGKSTKEKYPLLPVVLMYAAMIAVCVYIAVLCRKYLGKSSMDLTHPLEDRINLVSAACVHFAVSVFIFWPFIFKGHILVSSADNMAEILPLFVFSKHNFVNILNGTSLSLWNPYTHNGVPFFSNHWFMIYYPLNWFVFLFSDKNVLLALTFRQFVEVFLVGFCAYAFFSVELRSKKWALFSSIVYQLCSLLIFSLSVFPAISLYFAIVWSLYLVWSLSKRRAVINYALLTVSFVFVFTSANVAFIFYGILALFVLSTYRILSEKDKIKSQAGIVLGSFLTASVISAIRMLPCLLGILNSNRIVENYYTLHDRLPLLTRLFVPEIAGWFASHGLNALQSKNLNLIFYQANLPSNPQNAFFVYFGIFPALLLILSLFIKEKGSYAFWKVYSLVVLAFGLLLQPFWGVLSILTFPLNHYSYYLIIIPIGVCALCGHTGSYLEKNNLDIKNLAGKFIASLFIIEAYILVIVTYLFPKLTIFTRSVFLITALWYIGYRLVLNYRRRLRPRYLQISGIVLESIVWIMAFFVSTAALIKPIPKKENISACALIPLLFILAMILVAMRIYVYLKVRRKDTEKRYLTALYAGGIITLVVLCIIFASPLFLRFLNMQETYRSYCIDFLFGQAKFILIALVVIGGIALARIKLLPKRFVIGLFIAITTIDLLAFNVRFDNVTAPFPLYSAFFPKAMPFRDMRSEAVKQADLVNYRATHINNAGFNGNKNLVAKIPSYTGIIGYMPKRFHNFITAFGYPENIIHIYPSNSSDDERFLDLCAVRYIYKSRSEVFARREALSRLALFYSYEVIGDDDKLMEVLKSGSFNPQRTVLLSEELEGSILPQRNRTSEFVAIKEATSDKVVCNIKAALPAILLFSESYDKGWNAYIDGKKTPVYRANYNFMACRVNPGSHEIEFRFEPAEFFLAFKISCVGVLLLVSGCGLGVFSRKKSL